jgi:hypothetical protein
MDGAKQVLLNTYKTTKGIDYIFLQEGDAGFDHAQPETNGAGSFLAFDRSSKPLELVAALSSSGIGIGPNGGVGRSAYYNVVGAAAGYHDAATSDYMSDLTIKDWILKPADMTRFPPTYSKYAGQAITIRRGVVQGDQHFKQALVEMSLEKVQKRLNLLGHRRPKAVDLTGRILRIYYWHAPLGTDTTLSAVGFGTSHLAVAADGCNGELAVAANILFAKHIRADATFPANTILVGDLNINNKAAQAIYHTTNVISSADGWCHAIAHTSLPLTAEVTTLDQTALGYSDHAPIVFTIV